MDDKLSPTNVSAGRWRLAVALGAVFAMLAAACASEAEQPVAGGSEEPATTETAASDSGGGEETLEIAIGAEPRTFDVLTAEDGQTTQFQFSVYDTLTFRDSETSEIAPSLAESWEVDGNVWTFNLREGVTFHDGSDLTSEDVVVSFERLMQEDSELAGSRAGGVTDVRATDDLTVEIESEGPDPTLPAKVSLIPIVAAELADPENDDIAGEMNGTGAFEQTEWQRGQHVKLERNDDYWGEPPSLSEVTIRFLEEDSTRVAALRAGEVDIALKMPPEFADQAPKVVTAGSPDVYTVFFNTENNGGFADVKLRRAAALAIDRQGIIDELLGGYGEQVKGQFVGQYVFGSTPHLDEFPYDPEVASRLVEEAGGAEVSLSAPTGRWPKDREIAQAIAGMLEEVGFTVDLQLPEFGAWLEGLFAEGEDTPDAWLAGHGNDIFDMDRSVAWISCGEALSHYCNEELDPIIQEARQELDPERRQELYTEMWQMAQKDVPWASITTIDQVHGVQENVNWTPRPDGFILFSNITVG